MLDCGHGKRRQSEETGDLPPEVEKTCIAKRARACNLEGACLECSPVEQSLRAADWAQSRRPHVGKRARKG